MMAAIFLYLPHIPFQQQAEEIFTSTATGLEWMVFASFLVPAILLAVIIYLGTNSTV